MLFTLLSKVVVFDPEVAFGAGVGTPEGVVWAQVQVQA